MCVGFLNVFIEQSDDSAMDNQQGDGGNGRGGENFVSTSEQKPFSSMSPSSLAAATASVSSSPGSKCILRQPKLKFHASTTINSSNNSDGPFSFSINNSSITSNSIGEF